MLLRIALLLLLALAACDSGSSGVVLDGTFRGSGQSEVVLGGGPIPTRVDVLATFADETAGPLAADLRVDVTVGATTETYTGRLTGTLRSDGALSFGGTLDGANNQSLRFDASGEAMESRIRVDVTGTLPISALVLVRV